MKMASCQSHRPMTSKQARQAYLKSTRAPRLSRAEQIRLEIEEQKRIREEIAQRAARERAQAARGRKKQQEEQRKQDRKSKGLPLVDVRPSQDTIARFATRIPPYDHKSRTLSAIPEEADGDDERQLTT